MRLEKASAKAIRYAIMNYHYSKAVPMCQCSYSVFNNKNEWCGVICYSIGANNNYAKMFNLPNNSVIELVRVALNGKQESTSKAVSVSLKLVKKDAPLVRAIISYADSKEGHVGTIYQATNWIFIGSIEDVNLKVNGELKHRRTLSSKYGTCSLSALQAKGLKVEKVEMPAKHKYIYPLDKSLIPLCKSLSKPYPKKESKAQEVLPVAQAVSNGQEGFDSTPALKTSLKSRKL